MTNIKCCAGCVCVPACMNKHENDLIHNCSIVQNELKTLASAMTNGDSLTVPIDALNKCLIVEKGNDCLFVRCHYSTTIVPIRKVPVMCFVPEKEKE